MKRKRKEKMPENYELAPKQGMLASQRRQELDQARFVAVRNLAYMVYKKPDGQPLMTYQETLDDREKVKQVIVQHEIALGLLQNDLGAAPPAGGAAPQMAPANGVPAGYPTAAAPMPGMAPVAAPGYGAPVAAPQMTPVQPAAPQYQVPPAPATPAAAVQAASAPAAASAEAAPAATTGRRRRGAAAATQAAPAAPPQQVAPGMMPQAGFTPPAAPAVPAPATFVAPQMMAPAQPAAPGQVATPAPVGAAPVLDISPILQRVDAVGQHGNVLEKKLDDTAEDLKDLRGMLIETLAAVHHLYATSQNLGPELGKANVTTFDQFRAYLGRFTGNPK